MYECEWHEFLFTGIWLSVSRPSLPTADWQFNVLYIRICKSGWNLTFSNHMTVCCWSNMWMCNFYSRPPAFNGQWDWFLNMDRELGPFKSHTEDLWSAAWLCARFRTSAIGRRRGVGGTRSSDSALSHRTTCLSHTACCCIQGLSEWVNVFNSCQI